MAPRKLKYDFDPPKAPETGKKKKKDKKDRQQNWTAQSLSKVAEKGGGEEAVVQLWYWLPERQMRWSVEYYVAFNSSPLLVVIFVF